MLYDPASPGTERLYLHGIKFDSESVVLGDGITLSIWIVAIS